MCPFCMASVAMMVAGATSTGGLAAIVINKFRAKNRAGKPKQNTKEGRIGHEHKTGGASEGRIAS
jgi:hypothetical protein